MPESPWLAAFGRGTSKASKPEAHDASAAAKPPSYAPELATPNPKHRDPEPQAVWESGASPRKL